MFRIYALCGFLVLSLLQSCQGKTTTPVQSKVEQALTIAQEEIGHIHMPPIPTIYNRADSIRVVNLLKKNVDGQPILFYAKQFINVPYVASTLEVADPEQLVVNLHALDCTTLVETAAALTLTKWQGKTDFASYCRNLEFIRYRNGKMNGYLSRLHYFSWWIHDNEAKGILQEVKEAKYSPARIHVKNNYMSTYPEKYKFLKGDTFRIDSIRKLEEEIQGFDGYYLPEANTSLGKAQLSNIQDGDIIAIVTTKKGIDYSHLGFAVWGRDGKLHLLNASSIHKKVVLEPKTLRQYLKEHPSSIGIRVFRLIKPAN